MHSPGQFWAWGSCKFYTSHIIGSRSLQNLIIKDNTITDQCSLQKLVVKEAVAKIGYSIQGLVAKVKDTVANG